MLGTSIRWNTLGSTASISDQTATRTLLFRVGESVYGCDIDSVREIVPFRRATRLPGAPPFVLGLINLRGTILTVLDLGRRLQPRRAPIGDGSIILVDYGTRVVGIAVEEVMDVRNVDVQETAGETDSAGGVVRGLGHLETTVVIVLDIYTLIKQVLLS